MTKETTPDTISTIEMMKSAIAYKIAEGIRKKGITQKQTAKELGLSQPNISDLLKGKTTSFSLEKLIKICEKLKIQAQLTFPKKSISQKMPYTPLDCNPFNWLRLVQELPFYAQAQLERLKQNHINDGQIKHIIEGLIVAHEAHRGSEAIHIGEPASNSTKTENIPIAPWLYHACLSILSRCTYKEGRTGSSKYMTSYFNQLNNIDRFIEVLRTHGENTEWGAIYKKASDNLSGFDSYAGEEAIRKSYLNIRKALEKGHSPIINPCLDHSHLKLKNIIVEGNTVKISGANSRALKNIEKLYKEAGKSSKTYL